MKLPFSIQQFLKILEAYNLFIWPLQFVFYLLAIFAMLLSMQRLQWSNPWIAAILSFFWFWMGIVYHLIYFSAINKAAFIFGITFILEGILFFYFGFFKRRLSFFFSNNIYGITGSLFIIYALIIYPVLGNIFGHVYPASATFGLPCPTTILTFGLLLWTDKKIPFAILIIPVLWAAIGFTAAFSLGMKEDTGLIASCLLFVFLIAFKNRRFSVREKHSSSPQFHYQ